MTSPNPFSLPERYELEFGARQETGSFDGEGRVAWASAISRFEEELSANHYRHGLARPACAGSLRVRVTRCPCGVTEFFWCATCEDGFLWSQRDTIRDDYESCDHYADMSAAYFMASPRIPWEIEVGCG